MSTRKFSTRVDVLAAPWVIASTVVASCVVALAVSLTASASSMLALTPLTIAANPSELDALAVAAVDGDLNTQWTSNGIGAHLTLDWGAIKAVRQVRIAFYNGNARVYGFQIQSSLDGERYFAAGSFISSGTTSTFETFDVNATGRYLRIVGWGNTLNRSNAYNEVQAYALP
jgi:hypothetical protein